MREVYGFFSYNLDIAGIVILVASLFPIMRLMLQLPPGVLRRWWKILIVFILFFIAGYLYYAQQRRLDSDFSVNEIVTYLLFFGSLFVFFVSTLALRTALDVKRIYTLEIENITDPLMAINNRRHLERMLQDEFSKAVRYKLPFSVLMLDIDLFKKINDSYGHNVGDMVLKNLGAFMKEFIREADCVARYGGEEVVMVCPLTDGQHAAYMAERLRQEIERSVFVPADVIAGGREVRITVSIGVAEYAPELSSAEELVKRADMALYRAKSEGRNRIFLCDGTTPGAILLKKSDPDLLSEKGPTCLKTQGHLSEI